MIDFKKSAEYNNTTVEKLRLWFERFPGSGKKVWRVCEICGDGAFVEYKGWTILCNSCAAKDEVRCKKVGDGHRGKIVTDETRKKQSKSQLKRYEDPEQHLKAREAQLKLYQEYPELHEQRSKSANKRWEDPDEHKKLSDAMKNRILTKKICQTCNKLFDPDTSAQVYCDNCKTSKYCFRFDEGCREHNRDRYDRVCFLCGKTEEENGKKLDVHHVDYNKNQGCDDYGWKLVPLCRVCHARTNGGQKNRNKWNNILCYLIDEYWCD